MDTLWLFIKVGILFKREIRAIPYGGLIKSVIIYIRLVNTFFAHVRMYYFIILLNITFSPDWFKYKVLWITLAPCQISGFHKCNSISWLDYQYHGHFRMVRSLTQWWIPDFHKCNNISRLDYQYHGHFRMVKSLPIL